MLRQFVGRQPTRIVGRQQQVITTPWSRASTQQQQESQQHRFFNAAATSREKRALNEQQLKGTEGAKPPTPASGGAVSPPSGGGGGGNSLVPLVVGGIAIVGGGIAYSQGLIPGLSQHPEEAAEEKAAAKKADKTPATVSKKEEPAAASSEGPNKVTQISLPEGSKRSAPPTSAGGHPIGGNKVAMHPAVASSDSDATVTPTVDSALLELQSQLSAETSRALTEAHRELAKLSSLDISELDTMTPTQLKIRLVQLSKDLEERTKWEAVRLKEFLAMKEKEVEDKYVFLMKKQRLEAEASLAQKVRDQEYELTSQAQRALQEKEQALQAIVDNSLKIQEQQFQEEKQAFQTQTDEAMSAKYEELYNKSITEAKQKFAQQMEDKANQVLKLSKKLSELEFALQNTKSYQTGSVQAHRMSAAALSLIDKLESSKPAGTAMAALRAVAEDNAVITSALDALPTSAKVSGIATLQELQAKFEEQVHKKCRQAALVPAGQQGLEGQLLGMVFSTLKFPPGPEDPAPESDKDAAEFVLARARRHVQLGELESAVEQMEKLSGQPGFVAKDWMQKAKDRVAIEKALRVIRLECALANKSMSNVPSE